MARRVQGCWVWGASWARLGEAREQHVRAAGRVVAPEVRVQRRLLHERHEDAQRVEPRQRLADRREQLLRGGARLGGALEQLAHLAQDLSALDAILRRPAEADRLELLAALRKRGPVVCLQHLQHLHVRIHRRDELLAECLLRGFDASLPEPLWDSGFQAPLPPGVARGLLSPVPLPGR